MKGKDKKKKKIKEKKPPKMFPFFAGIAILVILCSEVFAPEEISE